MNNSAGNRRNPFLPWWIGLAIIGAAVAYIAYQFSCVDCGAEKPLLAFIVLGIIPVVYLALMYLAFRSQSDDERRNPRDYDPR